MSDFKRDAAAAALRQVESGMLLGLGTGSTAEAFVRLLGESIARGEISDLRAVCTSVRTEQLATSLGIACEPFTNHRPDLAIDGADEIDSRLRMIKGRGGALLREKIIEQASQRFTVIADESKLVERLGNGPFPIEVVRFASVRLLDEFGHRGWSPQLRVADQTAFVTDEGHFIIDVMIPRTTEIADLVAECRDLAGVVETGFFPSEATEAIVAGENGVRTIRRS